MSHTLTRTHVYIPLANPYLKCEQCGHWVTGWHDPGPCGCDAVTCNAPCCCRASTVSACPSWSPVDGCTCPQQGGRPAHEQPPTRSELVYRKTPAGGTA
ncbi:hypothetical protein [Streptomyces sp. Act143]|uniref:hypothetical protein n=1 Tax=Streptomyces sp. Act143 TaxID=2200760 RepID=UPI0011B65A8E|nr:hypothetical protein [Streptomyces sp. Act143]